MENRTETQAATCTQDSCTIAKDEHLLTLAHGHVLMQHVLDPQPLPS